LELNELKHITRLVISQEIKVGQLAVMALLAMAKVAEE
jgi:hypothetical protein